MKFISHTSKDSYEQMDSMGSNIVQVWYGNGLLGAGQAILLQEIGDGPLALGWGRRWWQWRRLARSQWLCYWQRRLRWLPGKAG